MIPAMVLTAGFATRLRPLSFVRAKAALPVAGEPLVRRILGTLAASGIADVVLNLNHRPETITSVAGDGGDLGVHVRYSWEVPILGSAGGLRRALPLLLPRGTGAFLTLNGDTLTNVDLRAVVDRHRESGALVTMAVVPNTEPQKYSGLIVDDDDAVIGLAPRGSAQPSYHFFGVQVVEAAALASVPDGVPCETVRTLYPALTAERRGSVRAFRCSAEYHDIGTPADYLATSLRFAEREGPSGLIGARAKLDASARIEKSVLWDDVSVGAGALLRECVVTDGVDVPADTSWHGVSLRVAPPRGTAGLAPGEKIIDGVAVCAL
jgi:NDP-sugar pyrophosphorylase family protein